MAAVQWRDPASMLPIEQAPERCGDPPPTGGPVEEAVLGRLWQREVKQHAHPPVLLGWTAPFVPELGVSALAGESRLRLRLPEETKQFLFTKLSKSYHCN